MNWPKSHLAPSRIGPTKEVTAVKAAKPITMRRLRFTTLRGALRFSPRVPELAFRLWRFRHMPPIKMYKSAQTPTSVLHWPGSVLEKCRYSERAGQEQAVFVSYLLHQHGVGGELGVRRVDGRRRKKQLAVRLRRSEKGERRRGQAAHEP